MAVKTSTNWATASCTAASSPSPPSTRLATAWRSPLSRASPALAVSTSAAAPLARPALSANPSATAAAAASYSASAASGVGVSRSPYAAIAAGDTSWATRTTGP